MKLMFYYCMKVIVYLSAWLTEIGIQNCQVYVSL